ncbi:MAG TPA: galactose-1-phosphate uridylyltransferase, partial [Planctomycetota bacterium]|nr:galactose-1-phosphate uridylyltransferase [Planctomycetota bacterium]
MSDLRKDPLSHQWVIITDERARLVAELHAVPVELAPQFDPFAPGNEAKTPNEIFALRETGTRPNTPGWRVRVVPNKFPVLMVVGELLPRARGVYDQMRGVGAHEIIIESPRSVRSLSELSVAELADVLMVWQQRLTDLQNDVRLKYGLIFQNVGPRAGSTVYHACSQLIALPVLPIRIETMMANANAWYGYRGRSLFSDIVQQESEIQSRVVMTDAHYLAFCPYASSMPFEVALYPRRHRSHF